MDDKYRSKLMYNQVNRFEEKVFLCQDNFDAKTLYAMVCKASRVTGSRINIKRLRSLRNLRSLVQEVRNHLNVNARGHSEHTDVIQYFDWFFEYVKYLHQLRSSFVDRIFRPLFKHFHESESSVCWGSDTSSRISGISMCTDDSGFSAMSSAPSKSNIGNDGNSHSSAVTKPNDSSLEITQSRSRHVSRMALSLVSEEYKELKQLYDNSDVEHISQRLSYLKERLDVLLDDDENIDADLFGQDSQRAVVALNVHVDPPLANLLRLLPDILIKLQKSAWLARKWLELDDTKTKDITERLRRIQHIEDEMKTRLVSVRRDITLHENDLEAETKELQNLLKREDRAGEMSMTLYELDTKLSFLRKKLENARQQRNKITAYLMEASRQGQGHVIKKLKMHHAHNKAERYDIARQISLLHYQRNLMEDDIKIELNLKPCVIQFTNCAQDKCERLEGILDKKRKEKNTLETALVPIKEDKEMLQLRMNSWKLPSISTAHAEGREQLAHTLSVTPYGSTSPPASGGNASIGSKWSDTSLPRSQEW